MSLADCDKIPIILVQNKIDLINNENPIIKDKEVTDIARKLNLKEHIYFEINWNFSFNFFYYKK